jgi:hypothetical protein
MKMRRLSNLNIFQYLQMPWTAENVKYFLFCKVMPRYAFYTRLVLCGTLKDDQTAHSTTTQHSSTIVNMHPSTSEPIRHHPYLSTQPDKANFAFSIINSQSVWSVKPQSHHFSWISLDTAPPLPLPVRSSSQHECQPKAKAERRSY